MKGADTKMEMKSHQVVINGRFLCQKMTGVQRYAAAVSRLILNEFENAIILAPDKAQDIPELSGRIERVGNSAGFLWEQVTLPRYAHKRKALLINLCNSSSLVYGKNIIAIHDLGVWKQPAWYRKSFVFWYRFMQPRVIRKALSLITVSQTIKDELLAAGWRKEKEIEVIPCSVSPNLRRTDVIAKQPLMIHIGTNSARKNISMVIKAFRKAKRPDFDLVLIGGRDDNLASAFAPTDIRRENISMQGGVSDECLRDHYARAKYLVSASLYEGFNLPVLEGILNGVVPILSDIPIHRELYEEVAIFFDPADENDLAAKISELNMQDDGISDQIREKFTDRYAQPVIQERIAKVVEECLTKP